MAKVDCLVLPGIFSRIKAEMKDGVLNLDIQTPNTPLIKNGIVETKLQLTQSSIKWLYNVLGKHLEEDKTPVVLVDPRQTTFPLESFGVNPEGRDD
jgi:hypothetical protein